VRTLALDPVGGIAGDMLIAALLHLGAPRVVLEEGLLKLGLPIEIAVQEVEVNGIGALQVEVRGLAEDHVHRPWREIRALIDRAGLPASAARRAQEAFALLARAEGKIHGVAPEEVEFHEVGALD